MGILGNKLPVILEQIKLLRPVTYIEIGCYRCETMKEVHKLGVETIIGFDLFEPAPENEEPPLDGPPVSFDEAETFGFELHKGDTNETLTVLKDRKFAEPIAIFIDGGHSFKTTLHDIKQANEYQPTAHLLIDDISMPGVKMAMEASGLKWRVVGLETAVFTPEIN